MRVKVAIDLALDRLFDYNVGPELEKRLSVGQLLSVPFGRRVARGFAMQVSESDGSDNSSGSFALKDVLAIEDDVPFFSAELLELVRQIASYTASPIEAVLKAALPAAVLKKNMRPKMLFYVEPVCEKLHLDLEALTKKQAWVYEQILRLKGGWMAKLCSELNCTSSIIKSLSQKGYVKIEERQLERNPMLGKRFLPTKPLPLNEHQSKALEAILKQDKPVLLFGVTGSGKTEVYLQAIADELSKGRGAIVMVPEISLTPQTMRRFAQRFGDKVALLHSALSDGERYDEWHRIRSGRAMVVVGPRSAVFAPIKNLGLIVVDEEHEPSYKQEELPRYHARDVAVLRGKIENAKVVLGSATPSLESWMNVKRAKYTLVKILERAGQAKIPKIAVVDTSNGQGIFSQVLLDAISRRLDRHEQTILFLNRRGHSTSLVCSSCGEVLSCPSCNIAYTYHKTDACLRCHVCGKWILPPKKCPECGSSTFDYRGLGIQKAEDVLRKCFKHAKILRMDSDAVAKKKSHDEILDVFAKGGADILIGTQMIAKGLDFPNVTLVGVLNADSSLNIPDFRAGERTFQLLSQVAGRAGRAELSGEVVIQSQRTDMPIFRQITKGDYECFAELELMNRKEWGYPPFTHLALVSFASKDESLVSGWAEMFFKSFHDFGKHHDLKVGEASPGILEKADGFYRWQIILRSASAKVLTTAWRWLIEKRPPPKNLRISFDLDAYNFI